MLRGKMGYGRKRSISRQRPKFTREELEAHRVKREQERELELERQQLTETRKGVLRQHFWSAGYSDEQIDAAVQAAENRRLKRGVWWL